MKSKVHNLTEIITNTLGPVFRDNPEYGTILPSMCLVMARVIQSTPKAGEEKEVMRDAFRMIEESLEQFLEMEKEYEAKEKILDQGVDGFDAFAREPIEPGSSGDYPSNPNQNIAKEQKPWPPKENIDEINKVIEESGGDPQGYERAKQEEAEQAKQDTYKEEA